MTRAVDAVRDAPQADGPPIGDGVQLSSEDIVDARSRVTEGVLVRRRSVRVAAQFALAALFLLLWEFLPKVDWLKEQSKFLDTFYISSPSKIYHKLDGLLTGSHGMHTIWNAVGATVSASLIGTAIGLVTGALVGLLLSQSDALYLVLRPFLIIFNAIPRVALIPIFIILFGPTRSASIVTAVSVVFFVVFFNALEGARSVPPQMTQNARIMGASGRKIMLHVRLPYLVAWTFAALPNAVVFGLLTVVTTEVFSGSGGLGYQLILSSTSVDSTLTFAVVVILGFIGVALVMSAELLKTRILHWWGR